MNIENIRSICNALPGTTEDVKWGHDLAFSIGAKMFCVAGLDQSPTSITFKVEDSEFDELCTRPGFSPAPYLARYKWIAVDDLNRLTLPECNEFIGKSYGLVKAKLSGKIRKELGI